MTVLSSSVADQADRRLQRRDRAALLAYAAASLALIAGGEWAILQWEVVEAVGARPVLARVLGYVAVSTLLWHGLLSRNRRSVVGLLREREDQLEALLQAYEQALALRDPYTGGHGRRVARYARLIGRELGLAGSTLRDLTYAARMHDIGKLGVPDAVLTKPRRLTADEFARIRSHPDGGARLLEGIPRLRALIPGVRHHHERYDGTGYPDGLRGDAIPLSARIIAVADALDALTTERPYRAAQPFDMALAELGHEAGGAFDPGVLAALQRPALVAELLHGNQEPDVALDRS